MKVLEILVKGPGKFCISRLWCGSRTQWCRCRCQNLWKLTQDFICIYEKNCWRLGLCPGPHSNCCLSFYFNIAAIRQGRGKMLLGPGKVLEIFVTNRVGLGTLTFGENTTATRQKPVAHSWMLSASVISLPSFLIYHEDHPQGECIHVSVAHANLCYWLYIYISMTS